METPVFEVQGEYPYESSFGHCCVPNYQAFFDTLEEAEEFAEANLEQYVIHMRMKLAEKRRGK